MTINKFIQSLFLCFFISPLLATASESQAYKNLVLQAQNKLLELIRQIQLCQYDCPNELRITNLFDEDSQEFFSENWLINISAHEYGPDVCQASVATEPIHTFRQNEIDFIIQFDCNGWTEQLLVSINETSPDKGNLKLIGLCEEDKSGTHCGFNYFKPVFTEEYNAEKCPDYKSQLAYQRRIELIDYEDQYLLELARKYKGRYFVSDQLLATLARELNAINSYHKTVDPQGYPGNDYDSNVTPMPTLSITSISISLKQSFFDHFDSQLPHSVQCINRFWHFNRISVHIMKSIYDETNDWRYFLEIHRNDDRKYVVEYDELPFVIKSEKSTGGSIYPCSSDINIFDYSDTERLYLFRGKWPNCPLGCSDRTYDEFLVSDQGELTYLGLRTPKTKEDSDFVYMERCEGVPYMLDPDYFNFQ